MKYVMLFYSLLQDTGGQWVAEKGGDMRQVGKIV